MLGSCRSVSPPISVIGLLAPELGWIGVAIALLGVFSEFRGDAERTVRRNFTSEAPFRFILLLRLALYSTVLILGLSLLLESQTLVSVGFGLGVIVFVVLGVLTGLYGQKRSSGTRGTRDQPPD